MRKLSLLLVLLLLSVLLAAVSAQASFVPGASQAAPLAADDLEAEEDEAEEGEGEGEESGECLIEDEEDVQLCAEIAAEEREEAAAEACVLEDARAAVIVNPGKRRLRLTVHYRASKPTTVNVAATLQGPKGAVHLGSDHARFRRTGVYRDTFELPEKQMKKALAASGFAVELNVVNAPAACAVELTGQSPRAKG